MPERLAMRLARFDPAQGIAPGQCLTSGQTGESTMGGIMLGSTSLLAAGAIAIVVAFTGAASQGALDRVAIRRRRYVRID